MTPDGLIPVAQLVEDKPKAGSPVVCDRCGVTVKLKKFCSQCGAPLLDNVNKQTELDQVLDRYQWRSSADAMWDQFKTTILARLQFLRTPSDGSYPKIKPLRVRADQPVFFAATHNSSLKRLAPGTYDSDALFDGHEWGNTVRGTRQENLSAFVYLNCQPLTVTLELPDWEDVDGVDRLVQGLSEDAQNLAYREGFKKCLRDLNVMSADRFFGGAQVQLKFRVADGERFLAVTGDDIFGKFEEDQKKRHSAARRSVVKNTPPADERPEGRGWLEKVWDWMFGEPDPPPASKSRVYDLEYKLSRFYRRIRMEFRQAVQQAVRNLQAADLMENKDGTRTLVRDDIQRFMSSTLLAYGIELLEVPAFEFLCPELIAQQQARGQIALEGRWLEDQRKRMELNIEASKIQREQDRFDAQAEFEDTVTERERKAELDEMEDRFALDELRRRQLRLEEANRFRLAQELVARRQGNVLAHEDAETQVKIKSITDAQQREHEAAKTQDQLVAHKQHLETLRADETAELQARRTALDTAFQNFHLLPVPVQQQLLATLLPDTQNAYIAGQQAAGYQQQLAMQQGYQQLLMEAQGKGVEETAKLLAILAQQAGSVLSAAVAPRQLPGGSGVRVTVVNPDPNQPPAAGNPTPTE